MIQTVKDLLFDTSFVREHLLKRYSRNQNWSVVRYDHILEHPNCFICGSCRKLHVHHIVPFHINPELELDPENLMTLCAQHHLLFGHLGWWRCTNFDILDDAKYWRNKYLTRKDTIAL